MVALDVVGYRAQPLRAGGSIGLGLIWCRGWRTDLCLRPSRRRRLTDGRPVFLGDWLDSVGRCAIPPARPSIPLSAAKMCWCWEVMPLPGSR